MRRRYLLDLILNTSQICLLYAQFQSYNNKQNNVAEFQKQQMSMIVLIICIFIYKTKREGHRWHVIIWLPSFILSVYHKIFRHFTQIEVVYLASILAAIHFIMIWLFPIYEMPKLIQLSDSKQYNVSCTSFVIEEEDKLNVTVFYPTDHETLQGQGDMHMFESDYWEHIYSSIKRDYKIPYFLLDVFLSGIKKYRIKMHSDHPIIQNKLLKPIIFSHGFMGSRTMYSIIAKQLASLGYVIFCVEHRDVLREDDAERQKDKTKKKLIFKDLKEKELDIRVSKIKAVIDLLQKEQDLNKYLGQKISVDSKNIVLMGHSYGGATAQCSAFKYPEFVKGLICLDPWLFPMRDLYLDESLNIPVLYINSETFESTMKWAELDERNAKIFKNCKQQSRSLNCYIKDMDHVQQGDIGLVMPTEGRLVQIIKYPHRTFEFNLYNAKLAELFLNNVVYSKNGQQLDKIDHNQFLEKNIFTPLKSDSYQYFRNEFKYKIDEKRNIHCLEFCGKSIF